LFKIYINLEEALNEVGTKRLLICMATSCIQRERVREHLSPGDDKSSCLRTAIAIRQFVTSNSQKKREADTTKERAILETGKMFLHLCY